MACCLRYSIDEDVKEEIESYITNEKLCKEY